MAAFSEASTIPAGITGRPSQEDPGWEEVASEDLDRTDNQVLIESEGPGGLIRLNPIFAGEPSVGLVIPHHLYERPKAVGFDA